MRRLEVRRLQVRTEKWSEYEIRFVEKDPGEWWAVAEDIAKPLGYSRSRNMVRMLSTEQKGAHIMSTPGGPQEVTIISELGVYASIMRSRRKEAVEFQKWVYNVIRTLRQSTGLEGFQIFRMLDKEHQKEAMAKLKAGLRKPVRVDFIKANTIANKAVSLKFGYQKMLKKADMPPHLLVEREPILDDTVDLMSVVDRFGLPISVSETIYKKYMQ